MIKFARFRKSIFTAILSLFFATSCQQKSSIEPISEILVRIEVESVERENDWILSGSGFLISKKRNGKGQGSNSRRHNLYSVVTAEHVLLRYPDRPNNFRIVTHDSSVYYLSGSNVQRSAKDRCIDMAVLSFVSSKNYKIAKVSSTPIESHETVYSYGWSIASEDEISRILPSVRKQSVRGKNVEIRQSQEGCSQVFYQPLDNDIPGQGMSGSPILNQENEVIAAHSRMNIYDELVGIPFQCIEEIDVQLLKVRRIRKAVTELQKDSDCFSKPFSR